MKNHINCFLFKIPCCVFFFVAHCLGRLLLSRLAESSSSQPFGGQDVYFALV